MTELYTVDTKALNHILVNSYIYQKPASARYNLSTVVGAGVLVAEEDMHRQQVGDFFFCFHVIYAVMGVAKNNGTPQAGPCSHFTVLFNLLFIRTLLLARVKSAN